MIHWRLAKNALANLGRGGAAAVVALVLPPILVRHMAPAAYAVWVLVLQTAAYVSFLDMGLQTAIGRFVAFANERRDSELRDSVFSTAFIALCAGASLAVFGVVAAVHLIPTIFPSVPPALVPQMRLALLIVGVTMAADLPASAWNGVFVGMQRFELPALTTGGARLLWAVGVTIAAIAGQSIVVMAVIYAAANFVSYFARYLIFRRYAPEVRCQWTLVRKSTARELSGYCFGLTVMSFSMLLVSGFDLLLVGRFQFSAVAPYAVAASMVTLISGLLYAVINVIMPHAATLHAGGKSRELGGLVISFTRLSVLLLILIAAPLFVYAGPIMSAWIGHAYVESGTPLLRLLIIANVIRLIGAPYAVVLVAAGQQSYIKISPLAEGISNFVASLVLGFFWGALGVALGTLLGSLVSLASHLWYSMIRTKPSIIFSRRSFLNSGVLMPTMVTLPIWAVAIISLIDEKVSGLILTVAAVASLLGAMVFVPESARLLMRQLRTRRMREEAP